MKASDLHSYSGIELKTDRNVERRLCSDATLAETTSGLEAAPSDGSRSSSPLLTAFQKCKSKKRHGHVWSHHCGGQTLCSGLDRYSQLALPAPCEVDVTS